MSLAIVYVTCRPNPRFEWFIASLMAQTTKEQRDEIELILIDGHLWRSDIKLGPPEIGFADGGYHNRERRKQFEQIVDRQFRNFLHIPPKPNAYQGPFRQTTRDFFCAANHRNTAFIVAKSNYVMFVDDLSWLSPTWFNQVRHAAQDEYILAGMYKKVNNLQVSPDGSATWDSVASTDSRWDHGSDGGVVPWHGSGIYGCSFGVPLEAALEVDGNDAACNGGGAEDCDFGTRLERAGWPVFLNRNCLTIEDEGLHHDGSKLPQERKLMNFPQLPRAYEHYRHAKPDERFWSDHVMLNRLNNEPDRILPLIGDDLRVLRKRYAETGLVPVPAPGMLDWRTGTTLDQL